MSTIPIKKIQKLLLSNVLYNPNMKHRGSKLTNSSETTTLALIQQEMSKSLNVAKESTPGGLPLSEHCVDKPKHESRTYAQNNQ